MCAQLGVRARIKPCCVAIGFFILLLTKTTIAAQPFDASKVYEVVLPSLCAVLSLDADGDEIAFGSGFVWQDDTVVTNAHVIRGASMVAVECGSQRATTNIVIGYTPSLDLVKLRVELTSPKAVRPSADAVTPGQVVFVLGNPYGLSNTITSGIVGGVRETSEGVMLQIDAAINPGNSGGPVVDQAGRVIGVATSGLRGAQSLNFAIPSRLIDELPLGNWDVEALFGAQSRTADQREAALLSNLEFRGLALGSACETFELESAHGIKAFDGRTATLLGEQVVIFHQCIGGRVWRAGYRMIPQSILHRVVLAVKQKYGPPTEISFRPGDSSDILARHHHPAAQYDSLEFFAARHGYSMQAEWVLGSDKYIRARRGSYTIGVVGNSLIYEDLRLKAQLELIDALKLLDNKDI